MNEPMLDRTFQENRSIRGADSVQATHSQNIMETLQRAIKLRRSMQHLIDDLTGGAEPTKERDAPDSPGHTPLLVALNLIPDQIQKEQEYTLELIAQIREILRVF